METNRAVFNWKLSFKSVTSTGYGNYPHTCLLA